jgi:hypothetical protein
MAHFLVELVFYFFAIVIWIFASPIIFTVLGESTIRGGAGFFLHLIPWVVGLFMVGRLLYVLRIGGTA